MHLTVTGVLVVVDVAYNVYWAYGWWIAQAKHPMQQATPGKNKSNPVLYVLREIIGKALKL